ncbi:MAG: hypothetical protein II359_00460 [Clostridia bacterium]|nr:hypothetical protein [Clostridia bacterium]
MKKWISYVLVFCMLVAFMPAYAEEAEGFMPLVEKSPVNHSVVVKTEDEKAAMAAHTREILAQKLEEDTEALTYSTVQSRGSQTTTYALRGSSSLSNSIIGENLSSGFSHTVYLRPDGTVVTWGAYAYEEYLFAAMDWCFTPTPVEGLTHVVSVAAGGAHSLALRADGTVWAWGGNVYGELGNNTTTDSEVPVQVSGLSGVVAIAAGTYHSVALKADGTVWAWGNNSYGQLGTSATATEINSTPAQVLGVGGNGYLTGIVNIAAYENNTAAITASGEVLAWGFNLMGYLNTSQTASAVLAPAVVLDETDSGPMTDITALAIGEYKLLATKADGSVVWWGYGILQPQTVIGIENIVSVAAGQSHFIAIDSTGTAYSWGSNGNGELGSNGTSSTPAAIDVSYPVVHAAAGDNHTTLLLSNGKLMSVGCNRYGQLGIGSGCYAYREPVLLSGLENIEKVFAGEFDAYALEGNGTLWEWSETEPYPQISHLLDGTDKLLSDMVRTDYFTLLLMTDGSVYAMGDNAYGQLGNGTTDDSDILVQVKDSTGTGFLSNIIAIAAGDYHAMALTDGGLVYTWGRNHKGQLGNNTTTNQSLPVQVQELGGIAEIAAGGNCSLARTETGNVYAWGNGGNYQLGNGTTANAMLPMQITGLSGIVSVCANSTTCHALDNTGKVYGWGKITTYSLGSEEIKQTPTVVFENTDVNKIYSTYYTTIAQTNDGRLYYCGFRDTSYEQPTFALLTEADGFSHVSGFYMYLLLTDTAGKTYGLGFDGVFGNGIGTSVTEWKSTYMPTADILDIYTPRNISGGTNSRLFALLSDGTVWGSGSNNSGALGNNSTENTSTAVQAMQGEEALSDVIALAPGANHVLALKADGSVWAFGNNTNGQLGDGTTTNRPVAVQVKKSESENDWLQNITAVAASGSYSMALTADGKVYAWGAGASGQLGNGTTMNSSYPSLVTLDGTTPLSDIVEISAGYSSAYARTASGTVYAWGNNASGQLGNATTTNSIYPTLMQTANGTATGITAISAGYAHVLLKTQNGGVLAAGENARGQLGIGTTTDSAVLTPVLASEGVVLSGVKAIEAGAQNSFVILEDSTLYGFGYGTPFLINHTAGNKLYPTPATLNTDGDTVNNVVQIAASNLFTVYKTADGAVMARGINNGAFGNGRSGQTAGSPVEILNSGIIYDDYADTAEEATEISLNQTMQGEIQYADDTDWLKFTAPISESFAFLPGGNVALSVFDSNMQPVTTTSGNIYALTGGSVYYIRITGETGTAYALSVKQNNAAYATTYTLSAQEGEQYYILLSANNMAPHSITAFSVRYDEDALALSDASALTYEKETTPGAISGTDVSVTYIEDGIIQYAIQNPESLYASGTLNIIGFRALASGNTEVYLTVQE